MAHVISVLGSTGSIGTQTLEVAEMLGLKVAALTANTDTERLKEQIYKFKPELVAVKNEEAAFNLKKEGVPCTVLEGMPGILEAAKIEGADTVVNAIVSGDGLLPTLKAIKHGKNVALANKEALVTGGELVMRYAKEGGVNIYPIDSEHSAIFQCLNGNDINDVRTIYLTASGGPFRTYTKEMLENVTPEDALRHPNWVMGKKITIDSATMMNKGFEVIEAKWLFGIETDKIKVLIHPQSVIHSMVEFCDGSVMAQMGVPDMRVPISYALTYPKRAPNSFPKADFFKLRELTFEEPNFDIFPCLSYAYNAIKTGGSLPSVLNYANETAVGAFLEGKIKFTDIPRLIKDTTDAYTIKDSYGIKDISEAEEFAKKRGEIFLERND
ncbi:MAG: 1-deoxy-D-xylulose-5-phosphate reductoisomerase [Clostridiales bacterium]|jgi:1-deoxy-D-xylulose-5-phosphate reductoisomerase|nr:1-deoxy-D-xylulose-5-phosphate reductoisomerase [Clostridiales bacterium]